METHGEIQGSLWLEHLAGLQAGSGSGCLGNDVEMSGIRCISCFFVHPGRPLALGQEYFCGVKWGLSVHSGGGDGRAGRRELPEHSPGELSMDKNLGYGTQRALCSGKMVSQWQWASWGQLPSPGSNGGPLHLMQNQYPGTSFQYLPRGSRVSRPALELPFPAPFALPGFLFRWKRPLTAS